MFGFVFSQVNETYSERCLQIGPARSLTLDFTGNRLGKFQKSIIKYTFRTKVFGARIHFILLSDSGK